MSTQVAMIVTILIMAAQIGHVGSYNTLANYDFHGLNAGTTSVSCTVDPTNNQDWVFESESTDASICLYIFL